MASTVTEDDYSKYSAFNETDSGMGDSSSFAIRSKAGTGASNSLADGDFDNSLVVKQRNQQERVFTRDEFLYALSSPSSIGAMAWILSAFVAVLYGSSVVVLINFCIPLLLGPFVINEQMYAQLAPSVRRNYHKIRDEANKLAMINVRLKGNLSRLHRQEYRLSAVEVRFEHLCQRSDKDITQMKHLAKRNATLRQKLKANLAAKKIHNLLTTMLRLDYNGNCTISEKQIDEIAMLMKVFAGKNAYSKFDFHEIHEAIVNSLVKNKKVILIPPSIDDTDSETKESEREYNDERSNGNFTEEPDSVQPSFEGDVDDSTKEEQSLNAPTDEYEDPSMRSDPSGLLAPEEYARDEVSHEVCNDDFSGMVQKTVTNGTMEEPIDIEKLVFSDHDGMAESNNMYQK